MIFANNKNILNLFRFIKCVSQLKIYKNVIVKLIRQEVKLIRQGNYKMKIAGFIKCKI